MERFRKMRDLGESDYFQAWCDTETETFFLAILPMRITLDFDPSHFISSLCSSKQCNLIACRLQHE